MSKRVSIAAIAASTVIAMSGSAQAEMVTFDLEWSGASFGNIATASGTITFDLTQSFRDNGGNFFRIGDFESFAITILNADFGGSSLEDRSYSLADMRAVRFRALGALDYSMNLVGQSNLRAFNFFGGAPGVPTGVAANTFSSLGRNSGDRLTLTTMTMQTVQVVPLPPAGIAGLGLLGCMAVKRRLRK